MERHHRHCQKCTWTSRANSLKVPIHEWPLPDDNLKALSVIFELQAPPTFCTWRDITYVLLHDICTPTNLRPSAVKGHQKLQKLDAYNRLSSHSAWKSGMRRICLASSTKSFENSHYKITTPTASEDAV